MTRIPALSHCGRGVTRRDGRLAAAIIVLNALLLLARPPTGWAESPQSVESAAACPTFRVREQDQVWLVSTRHLGCPSGQSPPLQLWRYAQGRWQGASIAEFHASNPANLVTPIYVHGNRINAAEASSFGLSVYFELLGKLNNEPPARFVIWSWPSDQIRGPLKDVQAKAARSDADAYYLGQFLAGMNPDVRVGIVGYSFGARIASGALHLLSGGTLLGQHLSPAPRPQVQVALWAAAEHSHWYLPDQFHGRALAAADAWFITLNGCDPVLARYRHIDRCGDPSAVGFAGVYGRNLLPAELSARIEEVNVVNIVGGEHNWRPYLYSAYIQSRTRDYALWHDVSAAAPGRLDRSTAPPGATSEAAAQ